MLYPEICNILHSDLVEAKEGQPYKAEAVGWIINKDVWNEFKKTLKKDICISDTNLTGERDRYWGAEIYPEDISPEKSEIFFTKVELDARLAEIKKNERRTTH